MHSIHRIRRIFLGHPMNKGPFRYRTAEMCVRFQKTSILTAVAVILEKHANGIA